jgi:tetratricopeptide (TPR) repeat protein
MRSARTRAPVRWPGDRIRPREVGVAIWLVVVGAVGILSVAVVVLVLRPPEVQRLRVRVQRLVAKGKLVEALALAEKTVSLAQRELANWTATYGSHHTNMIATGQVATALSTLGFVHLRALDREEAENCFRGAVAVLEGAVTHDGHTSGDGGRGAFLHPGLVPALENLARFYAEAERFDQAVSTYRQTLATMQRAFGTEHPAYATALIKLAGALDDLGEGEEAEADYLQAIALIEPHAPNDEEVAVAFVAALNNLGLLYGRRGRRAESSTMLRRALEAAERHLKKGHPVVEGIRNRLDEGEGA